MAQKSAPTANRTRVSGARAGRLYKLLKLLSKGTTQRTQLVKKLKVGMRTFYRDIDLLRECGVKIETNASGYEMTTKLDAALHKLPYPDPQLTFGDVVSLSKGRTQSHRRLKAQFEALTK